MRSTEIRRGRLLATLSMAAVTALGLAACSSDGAGGNVEPPDSSSGFAYGAPQSEIDASIADLDPVTLVYQPGALSPEGDIAASYLAFSDEVEKRSGGKITFDIVWGQAIAPFGEVVSALADGRLDIAFALPIYTPSEYPALNELIAISSALPSSPMVGDMVSVASLMDLAFDSEAVMTELESQGVSVISPVYFSPSVYPICADTGNSLNDFAGRQIRIASEPQAAIIESLGATPVSMAYTEAFEALQRNTINCTMTDLATASDTGFLEVAPNISYSAQLGMPRGPGSFLAGSSFANLPLAYQQILFDAYSASLSHALEATSDAYARIVDEALVAGGEIGEFDSGVESALAAASTQLLDEAEERGFFGADLEQRVSDVRTEWETIAADLGFEDGGGLGDVADWYEPGTYDFQMYVDAVYEEIMLNHRP